MFIIFSSKITYFWHHNWGGAPSNCIPMGHRKRRRVKQRWSFLSQHPQLCSPSTPCVQRWGTTKEHFHHFHPHFYVNLLNLKKMKKPASRRNGNTNMVTWPNKKPNSNGLFQQGNWWIFSGDTYVGWSISVTTMVHQTEIIWLQQQCSGCFDNGD